MADYYRYLAEFSAGEAKGEHARCAEQAYVKATDEAAGLAPTHPIRLGLALNFSVFMYEVQAKQPDAPSTTPSPSSTRSTRRATRTPPSSCSCSATTSRSGPRRTTSRAARR